jgi:hypothetical protein
MAHDTRSDDPDPDGDAEAALLGEPVLHRIVGLGARLCVTATRVVIVRDRASARPKTGIREWPHGTVLIHLEPPGRGGSGRVVLSDEPGRRNAVSLLVPARDWTAAEWIVGRVRWYARQVRPSDREEGETPRQSRT